MTNRRSHPDPSLRPRDGSFRAVLDALPEGVMVLDGARCISGVNAVLARMVGRAEPDLVGRSCRDVLECGGSHGGLTSGDAWPSPTRLRGTRAISPQPALLKGPDGQRSVVTVAGTYTREPEGRVTGAVLSVRAPSRAQRERSDSIEIVSTVSHELRSPLTSVKGYTSLMLNRWDSLDDGQKKLMLEQVNHDADRVTRLITELLDISRLETGHLVLRRQMVDLPRLSASVVEKVGLEHPDLEVQTFFPAGFPAVYADPDKIEQVLTNLVENACKYASPDGLRIEGTVAGDSVSVAVADRGPGIPEADLPRVFTKFFHRGGSRPTGSGLGLWISRGLIESHGGELRAESKEGHGSTFRFTLPVIDSDERQGP